MTDAVEAARRFVDARFPEARVAILAGSPVRGEATATSDLDIVIVTDRGDAPFRESFLEFGWPIEAFVHTERSYSEFFQSDVARRRPSLPRMCVEGEVLRDGGGLAARIRSEAAELLAAGPAPFDERERIARRSGLTDMLDDLVGSTRPDETMFVAAELAEAVAEVLLVSGGHWVGRGKWVTRALAEMDAELAGRLARALRRTCCDGETEELAALAETALDALGGRLFEGFRHEG